MLKFYNNLYMQNLMSMLYPYHLYIPKKIRSGLSCIEKCIYFSNKYLDFYWKFKIHHINAKRDIYSNLDRLYFIQYLLVTIGL
jgi:hypothetical protein